MLCLFQKSGIIPPNFRNGNNLYCWLTEFSKRLIIKKILGNFTLEQQAHDVNALDILPFILFMVVIVTSISEKINVPYPLLLVITGLVLGFIPGIPNWHPPNDLVLPLFLPPILFAAARLIAWQDIRNNFDTIGSLSIALVLITTLGIAWVLCAFIPAMTFGTALVLGAIISPTDVVAANAILTRMNIRQNIIRTVEVESLFNDAVSIVLYKAAVLFVFMGNLDITDIGGRTLLVGVGGIVVGLVFAYFTRLIVELFLTKSKNELPIIMSLILAYVAYMFADRVGVSGVLAVVTAGLYHKKTERKIEARTRLSEKTVWDTLIFFLNGILFISIGVQFPTYLKKVSYLPTFDLILFSFITILALLLLRLAWVSLTTYIPYLFTQRKGSEKPSFPYKKVLIVSWSGMRGLVSLALATALPEMLSTTEVFPFRNLIVFLTLMTILFTLIVQGLTLPLLIKSLGAGKDDRKELRKITDIYRKLTKKAIDNMHSMIDLDNKYSPAAKKLVGNYYANRLIQFTATYETNMDVHEVGNEAESLLAKILQYERDELLKMLKKEKISDEIYIRILRKLDRDQVGFASYR